jgi:hypothetical protein
MEELYREARTSYREQNKGMIKFMQVQYDIWWKA